VCKANENFTAHKIATLYLPWLNYPSIPAEGGIIPAFLGGFQPPSLIPTSSNIGNMERATEAEVQKWT
jgi:hypothetical protein